MWNGEKGPVIMEIIGPDHEIMNVIVYLQAVLLILAAICYSDTMQFPLDPKFKKQN